MDSLVDLLATIESGSQVGLNTGVQLALSRRHDELRDHVIGQLGKLSSFVQNNKSRARIDTVDECVDAWRTIERLSSIAPLINQALGHVPQVDNRRPGSGNTQNSISSSFCVVNEHHEEEQVVDEEPDEIKDTSSSVQEITTTDDDDEDDDDEPKIDSVLKMEQKTLIMENTTGSMSGSEVHSPSSIIVPARPIEPTYANIESNQTASSDDDYDDEESETQQMRPTHTLGGSGFDRQLDDLSSNALSSNALGGSSALSSGHQRDQLSAQLSRAQERENILSLAKPRSNSSDEEEDEEEVAGEVADSSILSSQNLRHIQMGSEITNMTRSNITGLSGRTKSTHLSRPTAKSSTGPPQGIVQPVDDVKPRAMGRGSATRGRHPPPRALTAFTSSHQQQRQHQQQLQKLPQGHFKETRETSAIMTNTIDMAAQLTAATLHKDGELELATMPRLAVYQKSHKCLDALVTCSLDGPGLFIAQFHPISGGHQTIKNRYKLMETFYTDSENERQGAFHKYTSVAQVKFAQFCVYRHLGQFERARVIDILPKEGSLSLFLIDAGLIITTVRPEQLASFPDAQYCFNQALPKLMRNYPRSMICRLVGVKPNRGDRFGERAVTRFAELAYCTVPLERRNYVRILPVFPHDLMMNNQNISSSGVVIPCMVLAQPTTDTVPGNMIDIGEQLAKQELVKRFEEEPSRTIVSISKLTMSEKIMIGSDQVDCGREEMSLTMFDFHYDRDQPLLIHKEKPRFNVNKAANVLRDMDERIQVGTNDAILNEGGAAYRKQRDVCRAEAKEPGSCRAGNRCSKIHPDGETDQYGELVPKRRFVTSVAPCPIAIQTGTSFIIKVLKLDKKLKAGIDFNFLYRIVTDVANDYFKNNELTAANCRKLEEKGERAKLRKHLENIYMRNKSSYKFKETKPVETEYVVVEHFSTDGATSSSSSMKSSSLSNSKFYRGTVNVYDAAKNTCEVQLVDEGVTKTYKMADVYKMNEELETYAQQAHPAILFNILVKKSVTSSTDLAAAREEASRLMRLKHQPFFLAEVADVLPTRKWNKQVVELKLSLMDDGAALNPDVGSMFLNAASSYFEVNDAEDNNTADESSQVHFDIVK